MTPKPDSRQLRVSQDVLLAIMAERTDPLESADAILRRKYGLEPKNSRRIPPPRSPNAHGRGQRGKVSSRRQ